MHSWWCRISAINTVGGSNANKRMRGVILHHLHHISGSMFHVRTSMHFPRNL